MQRHFSHIYKLLISPNITPKPANNIISRYLKNRQILKYCQSLWPKVNKQHLLAQGVDLRRKIKQAIDEQDKVLLMKVCSIPLYERFSKEMRTIKLSSWGYHFEFLNIYKVQGGEEYLEIENTLNPLVKKPVWIRVEFRFKEELDNKKLVDRKMWMERRVDEDNMPVEKKWYIYELQY